MLFIWLGYHFLVQLVRLVETATKLFGGTDSSHSYLSSWNKWSFHCWKVTNRPNLPYIAVRQLISSLSDICEKILVFACFLLDLGTIFWSNWSVWLRLQQNCSGARTHPTHIVVHEKYLTFAEFPYQNTAKPNPQMVQKQEISRILHISVCVSIHA